MLFRSTNDLEKRFATHVSGKGAKYTKSHKPLRIIHQEVFPTRSEASKRELVIKKLTKTEKEKLCIELLQQ